MRILVTGGHSGLGLCIVNVLLAAGHRVTIFDALLGNDVRNPMGTSSFDPEEDELDCLINCAGINRTGWLENFAEADWDDVMDVNAKGIFMMSQWALPALRRSAFGGTILNIVSNASHMPMTCSAAYNASKGAAHILTLQLARELTKTYGITVFGISPNKLAGTPMSKGIEAQVTRDRGWTAEEAAAYQLKSLLCGEETDPAQLADLVGYLLQTKARHKFLTGCIIPYGA